MTYEPQVNDYVIWSKGVEGWIYFKCEDYVTIEAAIWPKDEQNYLDCSIHKNERVLVVCYHDQWCDLKYIRSRKSKHEEKENCVEIAC